MALNLDPQKLFRDAVEEFLNELKDEQLEIFDAENMNATGESRAQFGVKMETNRGILLGPEQILQLDRGRKPGNMPPVQNLIRWVQAKGLPTSDPVSTAWAIAIKIKNEGTSRWRGERKKPSGIVSEVLDPRRISEFARNTTGQIAIKVTNELFKNLEVK